MKFLMLILSITFLFLNHPLTFGSILLIQTILISIITGMMHYNFWFSYILLLVMIGGMLILFIYMTSIASNEKFKFSYKIILKFLLSFMIFFSMIIIDLYFFSLDLQTNDLLIMSKTYNYKFSLTKFMNWPNNMISMLLMLYLLITLIAVVKITKFKDGPLRQKI